jgi:uncharacterized membrane protein YoaK (UPF0700 family)
MKKAAIQMMKFAVLWAVYTCGASLGIIITMCFVKWDLPIWSSIDWDDVRVFAAVAFFYLIWAITTD